VGIVSERPGVVRVLEKGVERRVCKGRCDLSNSGVCEGEGRAG
jgi:hypothetical protein